MKMFVLALCGALLPWCAVAADNLSLSFDEALAAAASNAPSLAAAAARDAAARHAAIAAGELPDPKLIVGLDNLPVTGADDWSLGRDFMTMQRVGVSQEVPNRGKRKAREDEADAAIADAQFVTRAERLKVKREAALAWLESQPAGEVRRSGVPEAVGAWAASDPNAAVKASRFGFHARSSSSL